MRTTERIQEWLADRVTWVQYPRVRPQPRTAKRPGFMRVLRDGFMEGFTDVERPAPPSPTLSERKQMWQNELNELRRTPDPVVNIPPGLPQTLLGSLFAMFLMFGWFVVFLCIGIPVLWICYEILKTVLFGS